MPQCWMAFSRPNCHHIVPYRFALYQSIMKIFSHSNEYSRLHSLYVVYTQALLSVGGYSYTLYLRSSSSIHFYGEQWTNEYLSVQTPVKTADLFWKAG